MNRGLPWFKVSVDFFDHPQVRSLSRAEKCEYLEVVAYCARYATDGHFDADRLRPSTLLKLVAVGLVTRTESRCFVVPYAREQVSSSEIEKHRESQRIRKVRQRCHAVTTTVSHGHVTPLEIEVEREEDLKKKSKPKEKQPAALSAKADPRVLEVFNFWVGFWHTHVGKGSAQLLLTPKRAQKVLSRLKEGYVAATIIKAVRGAFMSDYHRENGYLDLELICRSADKVDQHLARYDKARAQMAAARDQDNESQPIPGNLLVLRGVSNG